MDELMKKIRATESVFTLDVLEDISDDRLRRMQPILESEIKDLQTAETKYEYDNEELCQALDLLTLVEFKIGSKNEAFKRNEEAMAVAKSSLGSLFSRGNRIHLLWKNGYSIEVRTELNELDRIKDDALRNGSCIIIAAVKARQAYCFFRFGVLWSLEKAIALYEEALDSFPEMHLWRLQAGQAYRRVSNPNMHGEKNIDLKLICERKEKADVFFRHVTNHSKNPRLQAFAFSDLAVAAFVRKEEGGDLKNLCDKALTLGGNHPYVLLNCGKSLKYKDTNKAVRLLTKATEISPTTHTFHQLGNCLHHFSYKQKKNQQISKHLAKQAEESYRKAIGIDPHNIPACYSLGRFLRLHGKVDMALRVFTQIIREFQYEDFAITLMKVYEQASMCLLTLYYDLAYSSCLTEDMKLEMKKDAEEMLIKALSISFKFLSRQEIQIYLIESLSSVQDITDTQGTPEALLLLSRVYRLAKDPEKSLIALEKLFDIDMSEDPHVTTSTIETYLDLGCFEEALALMNGSIACNETFAIDESLYNKVVFNAARSRLLRYGGDAAFVFKLVFDSYKLKRHGLGTSAVASSKINIFDSSNKLDVLIIYDDSQCSVGDMCRKLQKVMNKVFGLNVSKNLDRCCAGIPQAYAQFDEMTKAELVLVIFGVEELDGYFESMLVFLRDVMVKSEENRSPPRVLIATTDEGATFPSSVTDIKKIQITDVMESLNEFEEWHHQQEADVLNKTSNNERINACVENMMSFFCSLLSISWPLAM